MKKISAIILMLALFSALGAASAFNRAALPISAAVAAVNEGLTLPTVKTAAPSRPSYPTPGFDSTGLSPAKDTVRFYPDPSVIKRTDFDAQYLPQNRLWNGCTTIEVTGTRIWVGFMTGGPREPDPMNAGVMCVSDDGGKTWIDPYIVIRSLTVLAGYPVPWLDPDGRLWIFINSGSGDEYALYTDNPEAELSEIEWVFANERADGTVGRMFEERWTGLASQKPIVVYDDRGREEWLWPQAGEKRISVLMSSTDKGFTWTQRAVIPYNSAMSVEDKVIIWNESWAVQLADGTLCYTIRIEGGQFGGMARCYSYDNGFTWTAWEYNLAPPFSGPGSNHASIILNSGNWLMINNNNTSARNGMTAYLSADQGKTWKSLLLEAADSSYPGAAEDDDGNLYISYDVRRTETGEIRITIISERDILNGTYSDESKHNVCVCRAIGTDIVSAEYTGELTYPVGTGIDAVYAALPKSFVVITSDYGEITLNGTWKNYRYWSNTAGTYDFTFTADNMPEHLYDMHEYLTARVTLTGEAGENPSGGCGSVASSALPLALPLLICAGLLLIKTKRRECK
ncbi:MAG: glycoside hydrolase [Clostridiales bacterium]|nr:glycoside hydrolase [Clostridiales bacterium]